MYLINNPDCCVALRTGRMKVSWHSGVSCPFQVMCCFFVSYFFIFSFQPAARKGADKSGPGAGFTVLSEKTLFLGQKVSFWQKRKFSNSSSK